MIKCGQKESCIKKNFEQSYFSGQDYAAQNKWHVTFIENKYQSFCN